MILQPQIARVMTLVSKNAFSFVVWLEFNHVTGTQYRSVIFYYTPEQEKIAKEVMAELQGTKWKDPIVTEIVPAGEFWDAEEYHQRYLEKNPGTCYPHVNFVQILNIKHSTGGYCNHRPRW